MRGQSYYTEPVDPQKNKNFAVYKQNLPTYSSMQAGPGLNSSCSMNAKHLVLTMSFLGLQCLNSKNIAVPSNERQHKTTKKYTVLIMKKKIFLPFQQLKRKTPSIALNQPAWNALVKFFGQVLCSPFVRARVHEISPFSLTKQAHFRRGVVAGRLVGWFVFLKFLSIINWLDQEAIAFGWFYT